VTYERRDNRRHQVDVVEVARVPEDGYDGGDAPECADESPQANDPVSWRGAGCPSVSKPATEPRWQAREASLDHAFGGDERVV
jgi:hypothetical protein